MIREQNVICMDNHKRPLRTEKINLNGALFDAHKIIHSSLIGIK